MITISITATNPNSLLVETYIFKKHLQLQLDVSNVLYINNFEYTINADKCSYCDVHRPGGVIGKCTYCQYIPPVHVRIADCT